MEFRTPTTIDPVTGFNSSSPIVGGAGYNPAPTNFSYNGNGIGRYTSAGTGTAYQYQQPQQQFNGYMNPPGGYVTSYNPYATPMMNYGMGNNSGPIFNSDLPITNQFYYQQGFQPTYDRYGNPINQNQYGNNYYASAWNQYNIRREAEIQFQKEQQQQQDIMKHLTILVRRNLGYNDGEEVYNANIQYQQQQQAKYYERMELEKEYATMCYISQFPTSNMPGYVNVAQNSYIEAWNKIYDQHMAIVPEDVTAYQFFNEGYANELWMDMLNYEALERAKDMTNLYSQEYFRKELHKSNPNYDPITGTASGKLTLNNMSAASRGMTIDDMEVTLPPHIANDEYFKKKERFMNTILSNTRCNISELSTANYNKERGRL